jgi:hypothetical protein
MNWLPEHAEAIPFSRSHIAAVIGAPLTRVNNWIDRNRLWQTHRGRAFQRLYTLKEVFDLAGFAAMRAARIPEKECAKYIYNYGFYRSFLHGEQKARFSYRSGKWDIGIYDPSAIVALLINMRSVGEAIFASLARDLLEYPAEWPNDSFESFRRFYEEAVSRDRLDAGSAPLFEGAARS